MRRRITLTLQLQIVVMMELVVFEILTQTIQWCKFLLLERCIIMLLLERCIMTLIFQQWISMNLFSLFNTK